MADVVLSPNEAAAWFVGVLTNHDDKKWLHAFLREHHPECLDPIRGNVRTEAAIAHYSRNANFSIAGKTFAQVRARLERVAAEKRKKTDSKMPAEIEDKLHDMGCIQGLPLRLLKVMWGRRAASQGDLVPYVWGDQPSQSALKSAVNKANDALCKIQSRRRLTLSGGEISWKN